MHRVSVTRDVRTRAHAPRIDGQSFHYELRIGCWPQEQCCVQALRLMRGGGRHLRRATDAAGKLVLLHVPRGDLCSRATGLEDF